MEQDLIYRGIRYVIGPEKDRQRCWTVYPEAGEPVSGLARLSGARGSFKQAVNAARMAIDHCLDAALGSAACA
jgi:hypothetical protein